MRLIFDIGAHDGADSRSYLQLGYRVVAVEANPRLVEALNYRFRRELTEGRRTEGVVAGGRLTIVQAAVTDREGEELPFYVSENTCRSSVNKAIAESQGKPSVCVMVKGRGLPSLFDDYGVPDYCKIDIEGADAAAVRSLLGDERRPAFISCEACGSSIAAVQANAALLYEALDALQQAGYTQFKLVDQEQMIILDDKLYYRRLHGFFWRLRRKWERLTGWYSRKYNNRRYLINKGNLSGEDISGYFGEALPGEWASYGVTRKRMAMHFQDYYDHTEIKQLIFWVDIHAKY